MKEHHTVRKIIHLDMDCFYAAVELRERPELKGKPVAVGGGGRRGVVTTCNYEARKFGVRSAMPGFMAREKCPELIFLPVRFDLYREDSRRIRSILEEYTPLIEPLSLDEAFLDVSGSTRYAWDIAKEIRERIDAELHLTASAGISINKMLAKIASDWRKPNGQYAILPDEVEAFMQCLPVGKIWGVGPKSARRFAEKGILTCGDLQKFSLVQMVTDHGKWGEELYWLCRGKDDREVRPNRIRKSLSNESTFAQDLVGMESCGAALQKLCDELLEEIRLKAPERRIRKAFVKIKYSDFTRTTRECLCAEPDPEVFQALFAEAFGRRKLPVRLLGTGVRFDETSGEFQPELFENDQPGQLKR